MSHVCRWTVAMLLLLGCHVIVRGADEAASQGGKGSAGLDKVLHEQATAHLRHHDHDLALARAEQLLKEHPTSKHTAAALAIAGQCQPDTPAGRDKALQYWRRLHKEFPHSYEANSVLTAIQHLSGWTFSTVEPWTTQRRSQDVLVARRLAPRAGLDRISTFTIYSIPLAEIDRVRSNPKANRLGRMQLDVPRERWGEPMIARNVEFDTSRGMRHLAQIDEPDPEDRGATTVKIGHLPGPLPTGYYVLEEKVDGFVAAHALTVSTFGVLVKAGPVDAAAWVFDADSGEPVPKATVELLLNTSVGRKPFALRRKTGADGLARFDLTALPKGIESNAYEARVHLAEGDADEATAHHRGQVRLVDGYRSGAHPDGGVERLAYITTDRPVYRPGQTVHYKVVRRERGAGDESLRLSNDKEVAVEIRDEKSRLLDRKVLPVNDAGSASGSFDLAATPPLGDYTISTAGGQVRFTVEAYRKPEYRVDVAATKGADGQAQITVKADYFFGGPVAGAAVQVTAQRYARYSFDGLRGRDKDRRDEYAWPRAPMDDPLAWLHDGAATSLDDAIIEDRSPWGWNWQETNQELTRKAMTDASGLAKLSFPMTGSASPALYVVEASVTDAAGFAARGRTLMHANVADHQVRAGLDRMYYLPDEQITATAKVTALDGTPARGVEVELIAMHSAVAGDFQPVTPRQFTEAMYGPQGSALLAPLDESNIHRRRRAAATEFEQLIARTVRTDDKGVARMSFACKESGRVRLLARVRSGGAKAEDRTDAPIVGPALDALRGQYDHDLYVRPQRAAQHAGQPIRLLVVSGVKLDHALLTVEGRRVHEARVVAIRKGVNLIEVPTRNAMAPNVIVRLAGLSGEVNYGGAAQVYLVPFTSPLAVDISTDRPAFGPREPMTVTVQTRAADGPAPAEVELAVVDESIFDIAPDAGIDVLQFFFQPRWDEMSTNGSLSFFHSYLEPGDIAFQGGRRAQAATTLFAEEPQAQPFGLGGAAGAAKPSFTRSRFSDTMYYAAHVKTDAAGKATVKIETPDNLTRWRIVARAVSGSDRFGTGKSAAVTRKDVIVRLSTPRFYNELDQGEVVAVVHNNMDRPADFEVTLAAQGAQVTPAAGDAAKQRENKPDAKPAGDAKPRGAIVKVAAGGVGEARWRVKLDRTAKEIRFTASALSAVQSDAVERIVPVLPNAAETQVAVSGLVGDQWTKTLALPAGARPGSASLTLTVTAPGVDTARQALPYLAQYPYGCVEQTMSRFLPALVAADAMKRFNLRDAKLDEELPKMVAAGLQRLYHFQHDDGGWGWWTGDATNERMTAYVLIGLAKAKQAGVLVDDETLRRGLAWLRGQAPFSTFHLYARALAQQALDDAYRQRQGHFASDDNHAAETKAREMFASALAAAKPANELERAYLVLAGRKDLARDLPAAPQKPGGPDEVTRAALALQAMLAANPVDPRIEGLVNWLIEQRQGDRWHSTLDTAWAVIALCQLPAGREAARATVTVNGKMVELTGGRAVVPHDLLREGENVIVVKRDGQGVLHASAALVYFTAADRFHAVSQPFKVTRAIERLDGKEGWKAIESGQAVRRGQVLRVTVAVTGGEAQYAMMDSPTPAGAEGSTDEPAADFDDWRWSDAREVRDDRVTAAIERLHEGLRVTYYLRPTHAGEYHVLPTQVFSMYHPSIRGGSESFVLRVE